MDDGTELSLFAEQSVLSALKEVQDTVRSYDTKAQIVGVGFIFSVGIISGFSARFFSPEISPEPWIIILTWIIFIGPIVLYGAVLYPSRTISPNIGEEVAALKYTYYFKSSNSNHMSKYLNDIRTCDWVSEIVYEIMKLSSLRELKRRRFLTALWVTAASYILLISLQILRSMETVNI
jgi:hypothetical protein